MELAALGSLAVLALIDSTSFGTLGIPVWMLVQPRVKAAAVLSYLAALSLFYWILGVVLLVGAASVRDAFTDLGDSRILLWGQLVLGVVLFAASWLVDRKHSERRRARRQGRASRVERLMQRTVGPEATISATIPLACLAGLIEAASMLPYLAAIGILTATATSAGVSVAVLAAYVVVMVSPALALLALRLRLGSQVEPLLENINSWLQRNKDEMLSWVLGIIGFLLAAHAAQSLELGPFS